MDAESLRLAELETQLEDMEKQNGWMSVQLTRALEQVANTQNAVEQILQTQREMQGQMQALGQAVMRLTERAEGLDETADVLEDVTGALKQKTDTLSEDIDKLYFDMNALSEETRKRVGWIKAEMEQFQWNRGIEEQGDEW